MLGLIGLLVYLQRTRGAPKLSLPPGPKPLPILGNFRDVPPEGSLEYMHWLKHKDLYGPITSVTVMGQTIVAIHDKQLAHDVLERESLKKSKYLAPHSAYFIREMRRKAYAQLLESYKTLSIKSMADAFGVSVAFLDTDLSRFIPNKKLNCIIDRVNGIIVTNRPDNKNAQYQELVKQAVGGERFQKAFFDNAQDADIVAYVKGVLGK